MDIVSQFACEDWNSKTSCSKSKNRNCDSASECSNINFRELLTKVELGDAINLTGGVSAITSKMVLSLPQAGRRRREKRAPVKRIKVIRRRPPQQISRRITRRPISGPVRSRQVVLPTYETRQTNEYVRRPIERAVEYATDRYDYDDQEDRRFTRLKPKSSLNDYATQAAFRESVWRGVQRPGMSGNIYQPSFVAQPYSYTTSNQPTTHGAIQTASQAFSLNHQTPYIILPAQVGQNGITVTGRPRETPEAEIYYTARETPSVGTVSRRPPDGENDIDRPRSRWSLEQVMQFLGSLPGRVRQSILTALFGTAVGVVLDILLGGPLGLTSTVFRILLRLVPGGSVLLWGLDGLAYILGRLANPLEVAEDPSFENLAMSVQERLPSGTGEALAQAAESQLGNGVGRQLGGIASAILAAGSQLQGVVPDVANGVLEAGPEIGSAVVEAATQTLPEVIREGVAHMQQVLPMSLPLALVRQSIRE